MFDNKNDEAVTIFKNAYSKQLETKSKSKDDIIFIKLDENCDIKEDNRNNVNAIRLGIIIGATITIFAGGIVTYKILNK